MIDRTTTTIPFHHAALGPAATAAVTVVLFVAILFIGLVVALNLARGWAGILSVIALS